MVACSAVAASLCLGACGSSSNSSLSRGELAAKANTICRNAAAAIRNLGNAPADFATNPQSAASYLDRVVAISDNTVAQLAALKPDAGAKTAWSDFVVANQAAQQALDTARVKVEKHDPTGLADFRNAVTSLSQRVTDTANAIGASACAG